MFDIGWSEMAVIALIALIVIGPKDLPSTMKTIAHWMRKARSLTREFQSGFDDMVREAELEDARKALDATRGGNLKRTLSNAIDPDDEVGKEVRAIEQDARREDSDDDAVKASKKPAGGTESNADSNADRAAAKMVKQPASVAPAHSLKPAGETAPAEKPASDKAAGNDGADAKPASEDSKQSA